MRRRSSFSRSPEFFSQARLTAVSQLAFALAFLSAAACNRQSTARAEPDSRQSPAPTPATLRVQQQPDSATTISREVKDVFERAAKAVVKIQASDEHGELSGTGFFVDPMGTLYTAYSVGGEAENFKVEFGGRTYAARQLLADVRKIGRAHV